MVTTTVGTYVEINDSYYQRHSACQELRVGVDAMLAWEGWCERWLGEVHRCACGRRGMVKGLPQSTVEESNHSRMILRVLQ